MNEEQFEYFMKFVRSIETALWIILGALIVILIFVAIG